MDAVTQHIFIIIRGVEFILGTPGNGFIVLVNCMDWVRKRKISSVDQILTALAISRIVLLWLVLMHILAHLGYLCLFPSQKIIKVVSISWIVTNHVSIWLATCLSIFYFLKVANFSNTTFRSLKWRVKEVVLVTLMVSLLLLSLNIVVTNRHVDFWVDRSTSNNSCSSSSNNSAQFTKILLFLCSVFTFISFTVSLVTFLLLVVSLCKHQRKMQRNAQGSKDVSTAAHIRVLQPMIAFVLLYTGVLLSVIIQISRYETLEENTIIEYDQIMGTAFSAGHSWVLILADSKLRHTSLKVLWWARCKITHARLFGP